MKQNTKTEGSQALALSPQKLEIAKRVDEIAAGAMELFKEAGSFASELAVAQAMADLEVALTDDMMKPVMAMMNSDLGFRTDRDPVLTPKDRDNNPMTPYSVAVVRKVTIEAKLRGFHMIGNEVNIIAGRFYACKNGLKRKCEKWAGVTDLKVDYGLPRTAAGGEGAIVPVKARWLRDGIADKIDAEIPVRVNRSMGADAILGKAERKIYKRIHDRLSGVITPDGEIGDEAETQTAAPGAEAPAPSFGKAKPAAEQTIEVQAEVVPLSGKNPTSKPATAAVTGTASPSSTTPAVNSSAPAAEAEPETPQSHLANIITKAGHTFDDFAATVKAQGWGDLSSATCFDDLSNAIAARMLGAKTGLLRAIAQGKGGAK